MKKVKVDSIKNYDYTLVDSEQKSYERNMEFIDTEVVIGDYLYLPEEVINNEGIYTYGPILEGAKEEDLIKLVHKDKEIYLQRYYG